MLIDDVRAGRSLWPQRARDLVPDASLVLDVNAVARYFEARIGESSPLSWADYPNSAPLSPDMWLEYLHDEDRGHVTMGAHMMVLFDRAAPTAAVHDLPTEVRWVMGLHHWMGVPGQGVSPSRMVCRVHVRADGGPCALWMGALDPDFEPSRSDEEEELWLLCCALTALCFAHCKGVVLRDNQQPRQQRRAAERAGRPPLVTFKTIDIAPVTRILREEGQIEKTGLKRALHLCRGHFAHYTKDKPLFGKHTGTFYIPLHVRGTAQRGVVAKDYRVLATQEQQRTVTP